MIFMQELTRSQKSQRTFDFLTLTENIYWQIVQSEVYQHKAKLSVISYICKCGKFRDLQLLLNLHYNNKLYWFPYPLPLLRIKNYVRGIHTAYLHLTLLPLLDTKFKTEQNTLLAFILFNKMLNRHKNCYVSASVNSSHGDTDLCSQFKVFCIWMMLPH